MDRAELYLVLAGWSRRPSAVWLRAGSLHRQSRACASASPGRQHSPAPVNAAVTSRGATARQAAATTEAAPTIHCIGRGAPSLVLVPLPHLRTVTTIDQLTS